MKKKPIIGDLEVMFMIYLEQMKFSDAFDKQKSGTVAIWTYRNGDEVRIISVRRAEGTNFERAYYESK
ncbi:MAG: hypothetical protein HYW49_12480 [Deltaproteobacteria bacterium]|nr:hypothetical protein [Deltaproteobacteria bacterium]